MEALPHPCHVPLLEAPPAGHPRAAGHLLGKHLPRNSRPEHEQNTRESGTIVHARAPTLGFRRLLRQEWFDYGPKFVSYEWFRHYRRILDDVVLLGALIALVSAVGPPLVPPLVYLGSVRMRREPRHPRYCTRQPISPRPNTSA